MGNARRRGSGLAYDMLTFTFGRLRAEGVRTAFLYVLDGNDAAMRLYKRAGFTSSGEPAPLPDYPGRSEELLQRRLSSAAGYARRSVRPRSGVQGPAAARRQSPDSRGNADPAPGVQSPAAPGSPGPRGGGTP